MVSELTEVNSTFINSAAGIAQADGSEYCLKISTKKRAKSPEIIGDSRVFYSTG